MTHILAIIYHLNFQKYYIKILHQMTNIIDFFARKMPSFLERHFQTRLR